MAAPVIAPAPAPIAPPMSAPFLPPASAPMPAPTPAPAPAPTSAPVPVLVAHAHSSATAQRPQPSLSRDFMLSSSFSRRGELERDAIAIVHMHVGNRGPSVWPVHAQRVITGRQHDEAGGIGPRRAPGFA